MKIYLGTEPNQVWRKAVIDNLRNQINTLALSSGNISYAFNEVVNALLSKDSKNNPRFSLLLGCFKNDSEDYFLSVVHDG